MLLFFFYLRFLFYIVVVVVVSFFLSFGDSAFMVVYGVAWDEWGDGKGHMG